MTLRLFLFSMPSIIAFSILTSSAHPSQFNLDIPQRRVNHSPGRHAIRGVKTWSVPQAQAWPSFAGFRCPPLTVLPSCEDFHRQIDSAHAFVPPRPIVRQSVPHFVRVPSAPGTGCLCGGLGRIPHPVKDRERS
ncbi:hypothetical protein EDB80DRAFT_375776 [Ilyonectria destructans]|nr:hypothetical protein EDB80DRAFT_375776 [Ilyonectria destructans]